MIQNSKGKILGTGLAEAINAVKLKASKAVSARRWDGYIYDNGVPVFCVGMNGTTCRLERISAAEYKTLSLCCCARPINQPNGEELHCKLIPIG